MKCSYCTHDDNKPIGCIQKAGRSSVLDVYECASCKKKYYIRRKKDEAAQ